ncbi:PAS domain S-box-containing protein [Geothermobacter ehrlichii]|uniref:histidine kinase n=1 Tax=Geothermobacter ehrlichii TaxID=213224 RepID=A0A5D3WL93_9BACT|nr:PAS domain S-box protein [Geothermobacter ehrlichii]TYO99482.1 PAS domain S-box-containing protein [Geothermobacter ehrlichii]
MKHQPGRRGSEKRYQALFNSTFQLVFTLDLQGRLTDVNRTALGLVGCSAEEVIGLPFVETPWWERADLSRQRLAELIAAARGEFVRFDICIRHRTSERCIDFSIKPIFVDDGVDFLLVEGRDITDYEAAARKNIQLKNLYDTLSRINATILHARDEELLLQQICDIAASLEEVRLAWIGFVEPLDNRVRPVAWAGEALAAIQDFSLHPVEACDVGGNALQADSRPMVIDDLGEENVLRPLHDILTERQLRSLAAFPLFRDGEPCGLFVVYASLSCYFRGGRLGLFEELAANTSFALGNLARERKRLAAERALRESETRYRDLVENARSIITRVSPTGEITYFNRYAEEIFGFDREEVLDRPLWETILPEVEECGRNLRSMIEGILHSPDDYQHNVNQNVCRDGRRLWIAWHNRGMRDDQGRLVEILSIGHDITEQRRQAELIERKASEEELRGNLLRLVLEPLTMEKFLKQGLRLILDTPWLGLIQRGGVFLADAAAEQLQLEAEVNLPRRQVEACRTVPFGTCLCGRVAMQMRPFIGENNPDIDLRAGHLGLHGHCVLPLVSGKELVGVLCLYTVPGQESDGQIRRLLESVADIFAVGISRRQAEAALRKQETLLRRLIDTIPLPIFYKDTDLVFQECNDAFAREVIGLPKEQIVGRNMYDIAPLDLARLYEDADRDVLRSGGSQVYQTEVRYADGSRRSVLLHRAVLTRDDGTPFGIVGAILDLSEHERLEEQLRHAQKVEALGTLTGGVAHDFNNFLTAIMGYASILKLKSPPASEQEQIVDQILQTTERASKLTYSLLAYSRRQVSRPMPLDINQVVCGLEKMLRRIIPETIEFATSLCESPLMVLADVSQLEQVLMNLVTNARDAMPSGGPLRIETGMTEVDESFVRQHGFGVPGPYVYLRVVDTGEGMSREVMERIFDPFFTTKQVGKGTGLGLSVSYGIVRQHRGGIVVESEQGGGSVFTVYLPRTERMPGTDDPTVSHLAIGGSELLLVVEDDPAVRQVTRSVLEEVGYRVLTASDGEEGLNVYRQNADRIAMVLTDIIMPRKTGLEMYEEIRRIDSSVRTIFFSGYTFDALEDHGIDQSQLDIIFKPVTPMEMLNRIRELLDA